MTNSENVAVSEDERPKVRCPECWKRLNLRRDGEVPVHTRPAKDARYSPPCQGSGVTP